MSLDAHECSTRMEEPVLAQEPVQVTSFRSPITEPVLTPETWDQIFRGISANDFLSVINAAPEWNHLLDQRKTTELFPMIIPLVLPYLEPNEMLACRRVQQRSKAAVDKILETQGVADEVFSSHFEFSLLPKIDRITENNRLNGYISKALALRQIDSSYNPFMARTFFKHIRDLTEDDDDEVALAENDHIVMTEFLTRFGSHIWLFNFTVYLSVCNRTMSKLTLYLNRMPNLKTLRFYEEGDTVLEVFQIDEFPLPYLEHLSTLDLSVFSAHAVTTLFVRTYGAQLTTLLVSTNWIKSSNIEESIFKVLFPKLKKLRIGDVDEIVLEKLSVVDWPLEALHLKIGFSMFDKRELLLTTISNFKALRKLELNLLMYFVGMGNLDTEDEQLSAQEKYEEESLIIAESAFKQSKKMEKLVAYWGTVDNNIRKIKIVKTQSENLVEGNQYKISHSTIDSL